MEKTGQGSTAGVELHKHRKENTLVSGAVIVKGERKGLSQHRDP